jgi:hypothetical protein
MSDQPVVPAASRPSMPRFYKTASGDDLLPWSHVVERLEAATNYWIATTSAKGRPHVTPIWAAWVDGALYFDGIFTALWTKNMTANPAISIHLESGTDVVILDGDTEDTVPDPDLGARIVDAFATKYVAPLPQPARGIYRLRLRTVRAWTRFPDDATRWVFETDN